MLPLSSFFSVDLPESHPVLTPNVVTHTSTVSMIPPHVQVAHDVLARDVQQIIQGVSKLSVSRSTKQFSVLNVQGCKSVSLHDLKQLADLSCVAVGDISLSLEHGSIKLFFHCFQDTTSSSSSSCGCCSRLSPTGPASVRRKRPRVRSTCEESSIKAIKARIEKDFPTINQADCLMVAHVVRAVDLLQGDETPLFAATQVRETENEGFQVDITGFADFTYAQLLRIEKLYPLHIKDIQILFSQKMATIVLHAYTRPSVMLLD